MLTVLLSTYAHIDRAPQPAFAFELRNSACCLSQVNVMGNFVANIPDELKAC